jgi:hypothetical protein
MVVVVVEVDVVVVVDVVVLVLVLVDVVVGGSVVVVVVAGVSVVGTGVLATEVVAHPVSPKRPAAIRSPEPFTCMTESNATETRSSNRFTSTTFSRRFCNSLRRGPMKECRLNTPPLHVEARTIW